LIKIPKKPFVNLSYKSLPVFIKLALTVFSCLIFFAYPLYYLKAQGFKILPGLFLIYPTFFIICYIIYNKQTTNTGLLNLEIEKLQEKENTFRLELNRSRFINTSLYYKISGYQALKTLAEELTSATHIDEVASIVVNKTYQIIGENRGNCLLYLTNIENQQLKLISSRKVEEVVIKAKKGDIFDQWVLKHTSALIVEDIKNDFRFDIEKAGLEKERRIGSLIASPLISDNTVVGILRMDNSKGGVFSLDDLRLLRAIADLGAVAIEDAQLYQQTLQLALRDGLTGLYLRRFLSECLQEELIRAEREEVKFSFIMMDIDYFKEYNDKYGHTAGDIVLKKIANILFKKCADKFSVIVRFGGEEFAVLLPHLSKAEAAEFAEMLREAIAGEKIILRRQPTRVTVSVGVASFPEDAKTAEGIIEAADRALYRAKAEGRNRICTA